MLVTQEAERARVAQELHDGVGHHLLTLRQSLALAARGITAPGGGAMQLVELAQRCIDETFAAARNLHPHQLARLGLARALDAAVDDLREASAVAIEADMSREDAGLDAALGARANHVYRVAQEALTNATRHAEAARIRLALRVDGATLIVTVEDDGRGFVGPSADGRASLGLLGMHERARLIGAELAITSSPGRGTTARLAVPLSPR